MMKKEDLRPCKVLNGKTGKLWDGFFHGFVDNANFALIEDNRGLVYEIETTSFYFSDREEEPEIIYKEWFYYLSRKRTNK